MLILKDLSKLGRELNSIIFIDNLPKNFALQPNNGLLIKTWTNDLEDKQLLGLLELLLSIKNLEEIKDVRKIINYINSITPYKLIQESKNPYCNIDLNVFIDY